MPDVFLIASIKVVAVRAVIETTALPRFNVEAYDRIFCQRALLAASPVAGFVSSASQCLEWKQNGADADQNDLYGTTLPSRPAPHALAARAYLTERDKDFRVANAEGVRWSKR
jgi:hypothetical protein